MLLQHEAMQRRQKRLIAAAIAALAGLLWLSSSSDRFWPTRWLGSTRFLPSTIAPPIGKDCAPYEVAGVLQLHNESSRDGRNRYEPFEGCSPVDYLKSIRQDVKRLPPDNDIEWLRDKTFVLFGDSQDRYFVRDLCDILGLTPETIFANDTRTPPVPSGLPGNSLIPKNHSTANSDGWGRPTVCSIPNLNLTFVTAYHWSLSTAAELLEAQLMTDKQFQPPVETLDRFYYLLLPLLKNLNRGMDVFQFASFNWDLLRLRYGQSVREQAWHYHVNATDLRIFEDRLARMLIHLDKEIPSRVPFFYRLPHPQEEAFPSISIISAAMTQSIYRTLHVVTGRDWRPNLSYLDRREKLHDVKRTAPIRDGVRPIGAGPLMRGYADFFRDALHPGPTLNYVQANVLLHESFMYFHT